MEVNEKGKKYIGVIVFILIFVIAGVIACNFSNFFKNFKIGVFITISGWLFSFVSLLFIFIVWEKFTYSSYKKIKREKEYLDDKGVKELYEAVENIYNFFNEKDGSVNLFESCLKIKNISEILKNTKEDCELTAYERGITSFSSFLNKKNIKSIKNYEDEKVQELSNKDVGKILDMSFTLKDDLLRILTK